MNAAFWCERYERLVLVAAVILLLASSTWWWSRRSVIAALKREPVAIRFVETDIAVREALSREIERPEWSSPPSQSPGTAWRYEIFTPPAVQYDASSNKFVVVSPLAQLGKGPSVGLELVEVRRQPYRLQLVGCIGTPGDYVGVFSSSEQSAPLLARGGDRIESLGITVVLVEMANVPFRGGDGQATVDWVARAVLRDEQSDEEVELDGRNQRFTDDFVAVFRRSGEPKAPLGEAREGDTLRQGGASRRIVRIQLDPPEVRVERVTIGGESELVVLTPAGAAKPIPPEGDGRRPWAASQSDRVATTDQPQ